MRVILFFILSCFTLVSSANNDALFKQANALYNQGKYAKAIKTYESILNTDTHSDALYFNLANAHYKLNHIAPSIFYFEKAKLLNPKDLDIKNNLVFANNMTVDSIDSVPEVGFSRLFKNLINSFSFNTWAKFAVAGSILFVLLFLMYRFTEVTMQKRIAFISSIVSVFVAVFALIMAFQKQSIENAKNPAIVFEQESKVKTDPNNASEEVYRLHEGTKVEVLETYQNWSKIEIADKTQGWLPTDNIKLLK